MYDVLLGARIIVACAHSIFWSIAAPLATRLVTREHRPMALSMIVTGSSVATIVGLPLGRVIGLAAGWRMTFLLLAVVAVIAFVYLWILLPKRAPGEGFTIGELPSLVRQPALACIYIMTALFATAYFTMYSYIEPFLHNVAAFSRRGTVTSPTSATSARRLPVLLPCSAAMSMCETCRGDNPHIHKIPPHSEHTERDGIFLWESNDSFIRVLSSFPWS